MIRIGLACSLIAALTIVPTLYTSASLGRWGNSEVLELAGERLDKLPKQFSEWQMVSDGELPAEAQELLQFTKSIQRTYRSTKDGSVVTLNLIVGRPGPIVRHPPEFCYAVRDKNVVTLAPLALTVNGTDHIFRTSRIESTSQVGGSLVIATAWSSGAEFNTTDYPRVVYGGEDFVYAIQIAVESSEHSESQLSNFATGLFRAFEISGS